MQNTEMLFTMHYLPQCCNAFSLSGMKLEQFLAEKGQPMHELPNPVWLADLAFLVDITKHLNARNTNLHGKDAAVSQLYAHIKAFGSNLQLSERHLSQTKPIISHFPALREVMDTFPYF